MLGILCLLLVACEGTLIVDVLYLKHWVRSDIPVLFLDYKKCEPVVSRYKPD